MTWIWIGFVVAAIGSLLVGFGVGYQKRRALERQMKQEKRDNIILRKDRDGYRERFRKRQGICLDLCLERNGHLNEISRLKQQLNPKERQLLSMLYPLRGRRMARGRRS